MHLTLTHRAFKAAILAVVLVAVIALAATGNAGAQEAAAILKQPGVHAIMRHALAPGTGDPSNFELDDCSTQRNLDERGREQASATGAALRDAGVKFDRVLTSQWCRCRETAALLALGSVEDFPALNSFFEDRSKAAGQTSELRQFLATLGDGEKVFIVTHQVNITALTGRAVSSGEVFGITVSDAGEVEVVAAFMVEP